MRRVRLYLDEDVGPLLARVLRQRGFDVLSAHETDTRGQSDLDQFIFAAQEQRGMFTYNIRHHIPIASQWMQDGRQFSGLVLSKRMQFRDLLARMVRLLKTQDADQLANNIIWLSAFDESPKDSHL